VPNSRFHFYLAIGAVIATMVLGCGPAAPPAGDVFLRWIDTDPETILETSDLVATRFDADFGPTTPAAAELWRGHDVRIHGCRDGALEIEQNGNDPWLAIDAALDADAIVAVEVELANPGPAEVQLFWAGRWQRFSMKRMARPTNSLYLGSGTLLYRFEVGDNPEWKGELRSLRVDVPPGADGLMRLGAVRVFHWEIDDEKMAAAATRPWKIDLGQSARNALLSPPGTRWDRRLVVPDNAALVLSHGLHPTGHGSVTFRVFGLEEGGEPLILFEDTVSADSASAGTWIDTVVDLAGLSGRELTLRLTTEAEADYIPGRGQPAWGNPEILAPAAPDERPNVVLVVLDTLRADRLSCYGHPLETSPRMDRWAAQSAVRFANVVAPAPWTLPSHASLFTGTDALRHGFNFWGAAPPSFEMVAEILRRGGYTTAAITGGGILRPAFGFAQGFDTFDYWGEPRSDKEVGWVFANARRWLDFNRQRRFFLFVHTYETHAPHRRRQPYFDDLASAAGVTPPAFDLDMLTHPSQDLIAPGDFFVVDRPDGDDWTPDINAAELQTVGLMYDSAVATVDDEVGRLLDHIRSLGLSGRTLVVVTSDHGEALGEDGRAGHAYLDDYNLMVPLILELPGASNAGAVVDTQVRLIDLMPTVLDVVGIEPTGPIDGRSLLPLLNDPSADFPRQAWAYAASSNHGLAMRMDNKLKYRFPDAVWAEVAHREALYDLESDPGEDHNLAPGDPRLDALRATTQETILTQHQGIRLEIRNTSDGVLEGQLDGAWAAHDRVKTSSHLADKVHWKAESPATFRLESGDRTMLLFTQLTASEVGLKVWAVGVDGAHEIANHTIFDLAVLRTPAALHLAEGVWRLDEDFSGTVETGFLITRVGESGPITTEGLTTDTETLEQLRALGYIQ
jgi:arylsulfatase A-like enzyme